MALQLHRIEFTKSMFVNGDINPSPDLLPATYEGILLLEREGKKREENKERKSERGRICFVFSPCRPK